MPVVTVVKEFVIPARDELCWRYSAGQHVVDRAFACDQWVRGHLDGAPIMDADVITNPGTITFGAFPASTWRSAGDAPAVQAPATAIAAANVNAPAIRPYKWFEGAIPIGD